MPGLAQVSQDVDDEDSLQGGRRDNLCAVCSLSFFFLLFLGTVCGLYIHGPESTEAAASTEPILSSVDKSPAWFPIFVVHVHSVPRVVSAKSACV